MVFTYWYIPFQWNLSASCLQVFVMPNYQMWDLHGMSTESVSRHQQRHHLFRLKINFNLRYSTYGHELSSCMCMHNNMSHPPASPTIGFFLLLLFLRRGRGWDYIACVSIEIFDKLSLNTTCIHFPFYRDGLGSLPDQSFLILCQACGVASSHVALNGIVKNVVSLLMFILCCVIVSFFLMAILFDISSSLWSSPFMAGGVGWSSAASLWMAPSIFLCSRGVFFWFAACFLFEYYGTISAMLNFILT